MIDNNAWWILSAGTTALPSTNEPDPYPITTRMFLVMMEYGKDLPNTSTDEDKNL
jgi:hypothetical protein